VLDTLSNFFKKYLEKASTYKYINELESNSYCEQIEYLCDEQICEKIKAKLKGFLIGYQDVAWAPNAKNKRYSDVIEDVINYLTVISFFEESTFRVSY
jgi:Exocyst complex subunit Sec15-like.